MAWTRIEIAGGGYCWTDSCSQIEDVHLLNLKCFGIGNLFRVFIGRGEFKKEDAANQLWKKILAANE